MTALGFGLIYGPIEAVVGWQRGSQTCHAKGKPMPHVPGRDYGNSFGENVDARARRRDHLVDALG